MLLSCLCKRQTLNAALEKDIGNARPLMLFWISLGAGLDDVERAMLKGVHLPTGPDSPVRALQGIFACFYASPANYYIYWSRNLVSDLQKIFDFVIELDKLKSVLRKTKPLGCDRYENSAEHSWQVCVLAIVLADQSPKSLNVARAIELLLVHDIPEIDAGDRIVYQTKDANDIRDERRAAGRIFGLLPEPQRSLCMERWEEYEARQSDEAIFAYAVDRLMPVLQNLSNAGQSWVENRISLEQILRVNSAIGNALPSVWDYVRPLIARFADATGLPRATVVAQPNVPADLPPHAARISGFKR